jgi:hypothetical protein
LVLTDDATVLTLAGGVVDPSGFFGVGVGAGVLAGGFVVGVGVGVGFGVGFLVGGGVVVVTGADEQVEGTIVSFCRVTAPFRASTRPWTVTPVFNDADVSAMIVPVKSEPDPRVAELPTCQKTLQACAPFSRSTVLLEAVISVDPAWKMKTALASPCPSSVTVPVSPRLEEPR